MAEFGGSFASFKPNTLTLSETAYNMELAQHFPDLLNTNATDLMPLMPNTSEFPLFNLCENGSENNMFPTSDSTFAPHGHLPLPFSRVVDDQKGVRKRKVVSVSDASSGVSSIAPFFGSGLDVKEKKTSDTTNDMSGGGKRRRSNKIQVGKVEEVIHVRAKRGQATDSHSLAERVRREKINERMRCLQELVPGCYKTMGMAVMLDEIINYVQSLQNQVEFLSMKLSAAANSFSNFNLDTDTLRTQQGTNPYEAHDMEWLVREAYGGAATFHPTLPL